MKNFEKENMTVGNVQLKQQNIFQTKKSSTEYSVELFTYILNTNAPSLTSIFTCNPSSRFDSIILCASGVSISR